MKIAINGTGVAGPTLAWWLKRYGYEPVLFEIAPELRTGGYVIDFWGLGYDIAHMMGILPELTSRGYIVEKMHIRDEDNRTIAQMNFAAMREMLGGRMTTLPRGDLAAAIYRACDVVDSRFGVSIIGITEHNEKVTATLSNGTTEEFDLVIGADGLHSAIRSLAFGPQENYEVNLGYYVAGFYLSQYQEHDNLTYVMHTKPNRQVARFSLRDKQTLFLFIFRDHLIDTKPQNESEEKEALRNAFADLRWEVPHILERMNEVDDIYFDRISQIHLDRWTKGRVALVGDAAACVSLVAGEGTGLGMLEAYVLAGELKKSNGDYATAFANYERILKPFLEKKQKSALQFASFFAPKNRLSILLRNTGIKLSSRPFFAKLFTGSTLRDDLELPIYE